MNDAFGRFQPEANMLCLPPGAPIDPGALWPVTGGNDNWIQAVRRHAAGFSD